MLNYMWPKSQAYNLNITFSQLHSIMFFFLLHCFIPFLFCAPCSDQNSNVPPNEGSVSYNKYIVSAVNSRSMGIKKVKVTYCTGIIGLVASNICYPVVFENRKGTIPWEWIRGGPSVTVHHGRAPVNTSTTRSCRPWMCYRSQC